MPDIPVPYDSLRMFREKLGLGPADMEAIAPFREAFTEKKRDFADFFHKAFSGIPETALILRMLERPEALLGAWERWFESLFSGWLDDRFLAYLWRIGLKHVEVNLDQRFSNLGFSLVRNFSREIILSEVPSEKAASVSQTVSKMIDLCLLVETTAYIKGTTRCDLEIMKGIADRIRNRVTVIGGNIRRLRKTTAEGDPAYEVYSSILEDSDHCERMVVDTRAYIDVFEREPAFDDFAVDELMEKTVGVLKARERFKHVRVDISLAPDARRAHGDVKDLRYALYHMIENAFEAADPNNPLVEISSKLSFEHPRGVRIEIFNTGMPPGKEEMEKLFVPFYSTKAGGTGFGLSIARMAVRKNLGRIRMEPVDGRGTRVVVTLPAP
jgi:signal transduction histidine kinase